MVLVKLITKIKVCYVGPFCDTEAAQEWVDDFYSTLEDPRLICGAEQEIVALTE